MVSIPEEKIIETKETLDYVYNAVAKQIGHTQGTFCEKSIDMNIQEYQQALCVMGTVQKSLVSQLIIDTISV